MEGFELIEVEANSLLNRASEIVVTSDEEYTEAGEFIMGCKALLVKIESDHEKPIAAAFAAHKAAVAFKKTHLVPVETAIQMVSDIALAYKKDQDRLAKEEADRIEADKKRADEEARLKEAERLEADGKPEEAEAVIVAPFIPPRPTKFVSSVPKVAGLSTPKKWKGRIVAPDQVTINYRLPDQTLINRKVQSFFAYVKNPTPDQIEALEMEIGGVEIYQEETFAGRIGAK